MIHCPLCEGESHMIWKERKYKVYRCKKCHLIFVYPVPQNLSTIYNEEYFKRWYLRYYYQRKIYTDNLFSRIEKQVGKKGKMLDVGCGAGILLEVAKEHGWDVCGQDISKFAVDYCSKKGFCVYEGNLPELHLPAEHFDLITFFDVMAHLKDPVSYVNTCAKLLKPGGYLIIKTPYHSPFLFFLANLLSFTGKSRSLLHIPAQIFHFNVSSLKVLTNMADIRFLLSEIVIDFKVKSFYPLWILQLNYRNRSILNYGKKIF